MYLSTNIAKKIKELSKENNISIKKLLIDVNLGANTMSNMKSSVPKADNLAKIADYLDCSVDYLLGRTDNVSSHKSNGNYANNSKNVVQQGQIHNSTVTISQSVLEELTEQEKEILKIFKKLSVKEKAEVLLKIYEYEKKEDDE